MKYFIIALFAVLPSLSSLAQTDFAISAGYNHNTARIKQLNTKQPTAYVPGFNIGLRVKTGFEPPLHFVGMLSYNRRGFILDLPGNDTTRLETSIHYVDLAPMLNYDFAVGTSNKFSLIAGPVLGIALSGKQKYTINEMTSTSPMKFSISNNYGLFNVGILTGLSYQFNKIFIEGTYHIGVTSINNNEEFDNTNIKNRGFALNIGYWFK
jgi:hypothetical protein